MQETEMPQNDPTNTSNSTPPPTSSDHPYDFHVCGPRNLSSPTWRDLIKSTWKDPKYKRMAMACFIQAVYLLELDRQESKPDDAGGGLAPKWWRPFKFKLTSTLIDPRDSSIYGAVLEWDRSSALSDFVLLRPAGAPRAVLALRGTLLKSPTIRRDLEDDLRFLAWESLKGSARFSGALDALRSLVRSFGSANVCVAGHSLGAGFALQVGKALAKEGVFVECHLFNPPSVSVAMTVRSVGEHCSSLWRRARAAALKTTTDEAESEESAAKRVCTEIKKWVPNLYVNNSDYICCYYADPGEAKKNTGAEPTKDGSKASGSKGSEPVAAAAAAKLFVMSKGPQRFMEAHGLEQWWADDMELQLALNHSKLIDRQLRSLYAAVPNAAAAAPKKQ